MTIAHVTSRSILRLILTIVASLFMYPALAAESDDKECESKDYDRAIAACTRILENSWEPRLKRASAYNRRGNAYQGKKIKIMTSQLPTLTRRSN